VRIGGSDYADVRGETGPNITDYDYTRVIPRIIPQPELNRITLDGLRLLKPTSRIAHGGLYPSTGVFDAKLSKFLIRVQTKTISTCDREAGKLSREFGKVSYCNPNLGLRGSFYLFPPPKLHDTTSILAQALLPGSGEGNNSEAFRTSP
jgi:hypothetical protein